MVGTNCSPSHLRARQLPQATGGSVFGVARPPRNQNDRTAQLRISYHTIVVRFRRVVARAVASTVVWS